MTFPMQHYPATGIHEVIYPNGLKALLVERCNHPIVTTMICYRVGGTNTFYHKTGLAHFLEHMMFKGTKKFPKGEIDHITQKLGGSNNAFTSFDYTCYYFNFASDRWEKALEIEADRMRNCHWSPEEFNNEKQVILEELRSSLDSPTEVLDMELDTLVYKRHPYRQPIIGWPSDLQNLELEDVTAFYKNYYVPNNAVLVIVGDISIKETTNKIWNFFKKLPSKNSISSPKIEEFPPAGNKRITLTQEVELPRFQMAFHTCPIGTFDDFVLDVIDIILSYGRSSRLYRKIVRSEQLVQSIGTMNDARKDVGCFRFFGELHPGVSTEVVEEMVKKELEELKHQKVGTYELAKAKNIVLSDLIFQEETSFDLAEKIAYVEMQCGHKSLHKSLEYTQKITTKDIQRVAAKYFDFSQAIVGWSLPKNPPSHSHSIKKEKYISLKGMRTPTHRKPISYTSVRKGSKRSKVYQYKLKNNLTLLVMKNNILPTVSMEISSKGGFIYEKPEKAGTACLVGRLLSEGTKKQSPHKIACAIEFVGGGFSTSSTRLATKSFSNDFPMMCAIAAEIIKEPKFSQAALNREKHKILTYLLSQKDNPMYLARNEYYRLLYKKHPYARSAQGTPETIANIKRSDIATFHQRYFVPNNSVISIVGDVSPQKTRDLIEQHFEDWKEKPTNFATFAKPTLPKKTLVKYIPTNKQQLNIYWGHIGISRTDPDYYALLVLDNILGVGAGFTDRLSKKIRDNMGLVYNIWASITSSAGVQPGTFTAFLATSPPNYKKAMDALTSEIENIRQGNITEEEVRDAKAYLTGSFVFAFETNAALANYLLAAYRFELGFDYIRRFPKIIQEITREQVIEVARKHLHPEAATTVVAGPKDITL